MIGHLKTANGSLKLTPVNHTFYWHIVNFTDDMEKYRVIHAFEKCFNKHLAPLLAPLRFESTSNYEEAHFKIHFRHPGDEDMPFQFDESTLAYALYPGFGMDGESYFNDKYQWSELNSRTTQNLSKIAVHEFCHNLNFQHSEDKEDVLYFMNLSSNEIYFTPDSVQSIRALYADEIKAAEETLHTSKTPDLLESLRVVYKGLDKKDFDDNKVVNIRRWCKEIGIPYQSSKRKSTYVNALWEVIQES